MVTGVILVHDEIGSLVACIDSLRFADRILAIADYPSPEVGKILSDCQVEVAVHPLSDDFSAQRNFALSLVKTDWVLFVDADEVVSPELTAEIIDAIKNRRYDGYYLHRIDRMWGHDFRHGDLSDVYLLRLARRQAGKWTGRVHETWQIAGSVTRLQGALIHTPHPSVVDFLNSINHYSSIRAGELAGQGRKSSLGQIIFFPIGKFLHLWLIKRGLLDGIPGLMHALSMSFYTFLVRGKLYLWK